MQAKAKYTDFFDFLRYAVQNGTMVADGVPWVRVGASSGGSHQKVALTANGQCPTLMLPGDLRILAVSKCRKLSPGVEIRPRVD